MEENFDKIGDYTLRIDASQKEPSDDGVRRGNGYTKLFNFLARQVTTIHRDWVYEGRGANAGGTSALCTHTCTESFSDLPSTAEVRVMHAKLISLGGHPPALEEILDDTFDKKPLRPREATTVKLTPK